MRIGRITLLIRDNSSHANQPADVAWQDKDNLTTLQSEMGQLGLSRSVFTCPPLSDLGNCGLDRVDGHGWKLPASPQREGADGWS